MEIAYRLNNNEIENLKKYKNPRIILKKGNILKNGKYKLHLTIGMFNKLLEKGELRYDFTDKRILNLKVNAKILAWLLREAFNISLNIVISSG